MTVDRRLVPSRRGCCHPRPSQTRTCRFPASGSSGESFAPGDVAMDDPGWRQRALLQARLPQGFSTRCLRFACDVAAARARLASGWLVGLCRERVELSGSRRKDSERSHVILLSRAYPVASWGHAERLVHKLDAFTDEQRAAQQHMRCLIWWFYRDLKAYAREPSARRRTELRARFGRIFHRRTGFA